MASPPTSSSSNLTALLKCLGAAAPLIPVPGIAQAIGVVISILEVVESTRSMKKNCKSLAEKAAQLVLSLHAQASDLDCENATYKRIQENIEPFRRILGEIKEFTVTLSHCSMAKQLLKRDTFLEKLSELTSKLDNCYQNFQISAIVHIQALLSVFRDEQTNTSEKLHQSLSALQRATIQASEDAVSHLTAEIRAEKKVLLKEIAACVQRESVDSKLGNYDQEWTITQRELRPVRVHTFRTQSHAGVILAKYQDQDVIVKKFDAAEIFIREMEIWRAICWHQCLPQFLGHSSDSDKEKFIVLRGGFVARNIKRFLECSFEENTITGFLKGLDMLYRISSATNYLRSEQILTRTEIANCLQLSSMALSDENQVMLGESLVSHATQTQRYIPECHRNVTMEVSLGCAFFKMSLDMTSPSKLPSRFRALHADGGHGPYSILQLLGNFSSLGPRGRSMSQVFGRIEQAWLAVDEIKRNKYPSQITFPDIRKVLLSIDDFPASRAYSLRDHQHWDISTGNLGYVRNGEFVCLTNLLGTSGLQEEPKILLQVHCDPPRPFTVSSISDDWDRYEFSSPAYAYFYHSSGYGIDGAAAIRHLLEFAPQYLEQYKEHTIAPSDLILIDNKDTAPRCFALFSYQSTDAESCNPPEKVFFFLKKTRVPGEAWGYWSLDPDWVLLPPGLASNIVDSKIGCSAAVYQRFFTFVQLEREDATGPQTDQSQSH